MGFALIFSKGEFKNCREVKRIRRFYKIYRQLFLLTRFSKYSQVLTEGYKCSFLEWKHFS